MLNILLSLIYKYTKFKRGEYPLSIIYHHHVFEKSSEYHTDDIIAEAFEQQVTFLKKHFTILPLAQAITLLAQKKLPPKALAITFDDGYQDNFTVAAPILEKHNCPATFFISTEGVEKGYLWNDIVEQCITKTEQTEISANIMGEVIPLTTLTEKTFAYGKLVNNLKFKANDERSSIIERLQHNLKVFDFSTTMMDSSQIKALHTKGFEIGAHTHSHTILSTESNEHALQELTNNKSKLESMIDQPVNFLAFPNGLFQRDFTETHCDIAKELGFKAAFSTNDGGAFSSTNIYTVPRFMPYRKQLPLFALSIAKIAGEHV